MKGRLAGDARLGFSAAIVGAGAVCLYELVVTRAVAQGHVPGGAFVRFVALDLVLTAIWALMAAAVVAFLFAVPRLVLAVFRPEAARTWGGPGSGAGLGPNPVVPWVWTACLVLPAFVAASSGFHFWVHKHIKAEQYTYLVPAVAELGFVAVLAAVGVALGWAFRALGRVLDPPIGALNPFGRLVPALGLIAVAAIVPGKLLLKWLPSLRDVVPWRLLFSYGVFAAVVGGVAPWLVRRGGLLPRDPTRRRGVKWSIGAAVVLLAPATLWRWGADPIAKYLAVQESPFLSKMVDFVRWANDFDRDGYGSLLGENDCAPFDPKIHPGAVDIPDNGIDENCNGHDFTLKDIPAFRKGERMPVPPAYRKDWNFLLITVDATRYDHTGFGGYLKRRGRLTTPNLDDLVKKGISFTFANAPAAGTMASVPGIVTSKFFHSGIALGPERSPMPPKVLPENLLVGEIMHRGGYRTGAILTHEYFNDWGLDQGIDEYDNALGKTPNPSSITSQDVTAKATAWIAKQGDAKWFLWCHYLDPHGKYMAHPGEVQFGATEEDLYDGELAYADKWIGRLVDFIQRSPGAGRTIIVITSDHGDGFGEHGYINHGMALYGDLLHVPLIFYIPDAEPHTVDGPVSPLDIVPTMADLAGIDMSDDVVEGESLIPQLLYGRDARDRVVFAETNYPNSDWQRAAIADDYKLIFHQMSNLYELYDLKADPGEKKNIWPTSPEPGAKMRGLLDAWMDRSFFARDPHNQAQMKRMERFMLPARPTPQHTPVGGEATAAGTIQVLGWDAPPAHPGSDLGITVYLGCAQPTADVLHLELDVNGGRQEKFLAGDGIFPTNKWKPGDYVKETFRLRVPAGAGPFKLTARFLDEQRRPVAELPLGDLDMSPN